MVLKKNYHLRSTSDPSLPACFMHRHRGIGASGNLFFYLKLITVNVQEKSMIKRKNMLFRTVLAGLVFLAGTMFFPGGRAMAGNHSLILTMPPILAAHAGNILPPGNSPIPPARTSAFLARATFGPKIEEISTLAASGDYNGWLNSQFAQPPSYHLGWMRQRLPDIAWKTYSDLVHIAKRDAWWDIVVHGNDQLRQRVAFALSEIFVTSQFGPLINEP
ncbi:MAG TPA: DUF1800 family protein, partial [Desulfobulbaceae bacterium]|nr:DUF1800 family protein [Desulfobulbaceae bacterium]